LSKLNGADQFLSILLRAPKRAIHKLKSSWLLTLLDAPYPSIAKRTKFKKHCQKSYAMEDCWTFHCAIDQIAKLNQQLSTCVWTKIFKASRSYNDVHIPWHNDVMMKRMHAPPPHQPTL
jgi:hypothetical protein